MSPIQDQSSRVVTAINGGLGNQMFQYAIARRFAYINQADLLLYLGSSYKSGSFRAYGLSHFRIVGHLATKSEAGGLRRVKRARKRLARLFPRLLPAPDPELVSEPDLRFQPAVLNLSGRIKLSGRWLHEEYFADIANIIRDDFTLRDGFDNRSREALNRIKSGPSSFIHIRRGDYVFGGYSTCSLDYYRAAVRILHERESAKVRFFVFSDDPVWAREAQIGGADAEIIDWNGNAPERDIALMRNCQHAIIANSTFSWWGAWLGDGSSRTVIAPRVWYRERTDCDDVVPKRWLRL